jgi:tRNA-specific 2-thiouridylase
VIGNHIGLMHYTIGQRKGLNIGGNEDRIFVVGKDLDKNVLYIAHGDNNKYLYSNSAVIEDVNWISDNKPTKCTAKFRYRQMDNDVEIEFIDSTNILVKYPQKIKAVTPGQACVFYLGDECLGGGIIKEVRLDNEKLWYV